MKNKLKYCLIAAGAVLSVASFTSCDDMLDTDPRVTAMSQATFPGKPADVEALNAATYSIMNTMGGGDCDTQHPWYWWEIMSDNCYGSGGLQDNKVKSLHHLVQTNVDQYEQLFVLLYGGISRANNQIETIDNVDWNTDALKKKRNQLLGEGYFMRGFYTLILTQMYGDVPLITTTAITDDMWQQVSAEEAIYPQILSDFVSAKNLMGDKAYAGSGHANKYVAEAYIARAYMFWAGFYKNVVDLAKGGAPAINLVEQEGCQGGTLSQADVVAGLKEIIGSGVYKLLADYRSLWQYSNSFIYNETKDESNPYSFAFIADMDPANCFDQPGMGNGNDEELFQIQFMNASKWAIGGTYSTARMYTNYLSTFWGLRVNGDNGDKDHTYPFNEGWGQGTPSCNIWDDWTLAEANNGNPYTDIRKLGSLIDCVNELQAYSFVKDDCEESGYAVKKYADVCPATAGLSKNDSWWSCCEGYGGSSLDNKMQGDHFQDFYLMRYADVLLMASELTGDASYMNKVQARAGVPQTPYTLVNLQNERRWEFAFEGLRFNDMRRWTGKDHVTDYAPKALQAQAGKKVVVKGATGNKWSMKHMHDGWADRYNATNGFLSKPQAQITLMEGKMEQNPGWDPTDPKTQYVDLYN